MIRIANIFLPVALNILLLTFQASDFYIALGALAWMVHWWVFEVLPLGITALLPIVYFPLTGIMSLTDVTAKYSNPVIYLFLGGFILARGLEKTELSKRFALLILKITGRSDTGIIVGFIIATATLSMWISNTATTVMMVPIAMSVIYFLKDKLSKEDQDSLTNFGIVLFLAIAYSANIGGVMTPVGTPPNVVLLGFLNDDYNITIDFWKWMLMTLPVGLVILNLQYILLSRFFKFDVPIDHKFRNFVKAQYKALGKMSQEQKVTLYIFVSVCFLWIFKGLIHYLVGHKFLNDTSIAIFGSILLFFIPTQKTKWTPILNAKDIGFLPWNIILLFGGGMGVAAALKKVGVLEAATNYIISFDISSPYILVLVLATTALFLTEIMSNVALCVVALPLFMDLAVKMNLNPVIVGIPVAVCASMAFSMPISTPPNAIVFGTNMIQIKHMLKAGIALNFIAITVVMSLGWWALGWFY